VAESHGLLVQVRQLVLYPRVGGDPTPSPTLYWPDSLAEPLNRIGRHTGMEGREGTGGAGGEPHPRSGRNRRAHDPSMSYIIRRARLCLGSHSTLLMHLRE